MPIDAIKADTDKSVGEIDKWLLLTKSFHYGLIFQKKEPMIEHEKFREVKNKFDKHFSEKPGK